MTWIQLPVPRTEGVGELRLACALSETLSHTLLPLTAAMQDPGIVVSYLGAIPGGV